MRTVAFLNRKGGVGKTSCVHHLAGTLSLAGRRVLLVDTDPQASLTQGLLGPEVAWSLPEGETLAALYHEAGGAPLPSLIRSTPVPGVWLVPGSERMDHYNVPDPWLTGEDQFVLRDALGEVRGDFDLALLDGPPTRPVLCVERAGSRGSGSWYRSSPRTTGLRAWRRSRIPLTASGRSPTPPSPYSGSWSRCTTRPSRSTSPTKRT